MFGGVTYFSSIDYLRSVSSYFIPFFLGVMMSKYKNVHDLVIENKVTYGLCFVFYCLIVGYFGNHSSDFTGRCIRLATGILSIPILFNFFSHTQFYRVTEGHYLC